MRTACVVAVLLLALLAVFVLRAQERAGDVDDDADEVLVLPGTVDRIVDGDTVDVLLDSGEIRVRMQGIDASERGQPLDDEAVALLRRLLDDGDVELQPAEQTSYERMVARIYVDGDDVNAAMVRRGFAYAERRFLREFDDGEDYCVFEHAARTERLGIWRLPADQRDAPWEWRRRNERTTPFTDYGNETVATCIAAIGKPLSQAEQRDQPEAEGSWSCSTPKTCGQMQSCAEAEFYLNTCDLRSLDGDDIAARAAFNCCSDAAEVVNVPAA